MSASDKKKLRKELNAAAMTEKQLAEQKKQKKAKAATVTFIVAMVLVVVLVITSVLVTPITNAMIKNTMAAKVGDKEISASELNYFYHDAISNMYNQFSSYGDYADLYFQLYTGIATTTPLNEQVQNKETGATWADYFVDSAISSAKWVYTMCAEAEKANYTLSEDELKSVDTTISYMSLYASFYGYSSADAYIQVMYGRTASIETYKDYYTKCQLASSYANSHYDGLEYTNDDYRTHEAEKMAEFNSYSWATYYVKASNYLTFLKLGTTEKGDDGKDKITYSDEDNKAALDAAKADADKLFNREYTSIEDLNTAINALDINKDAKTAASATEYTNKLYAYAESYTPSEDALKWLTSNARTEGDMIVIPATTTDADGKETTSGYYVMYYVGSIDNSEAYIGTVRHLLVAFEEDKDGNVTDDAKAKAKKEAEDLLAEYQAGKKTELDFATLIKEHSDDTEDGLYSDITPDSNYVDAFKNWATAKHEKGDVEIVETEYGYHIMYYVSCNELNYRDYLIDSALRTDAYNAWEEGLLKDVTTEKLDLKYVDSDLVISSK